MMSHVLSTPLLKTHLPAANPTDAHTIVMKTYQ